MELLCTMEETEELRWALKVIIKRQMQHLMDQLRQTGEEVAVLSVNLEENTYSHFGSPAGEGFIAEQKNLTKNFLAFCKKTTDDLPEKPASEPEAPFKPPPAQVSKQPAKKAVKPVDKPIEAPAELDLPSTSSSESGTGKVLMINIPRLLSKKNISDEKVAGMVGRIVAAKLMDKKLPQGDGDQSKFAELVEAAVQARTLRSGAKRPREASESPQEKRARIDSGEVSTPKITPPQDATRTRSGRKISSKYLESINSLRGGKPIKTEADADTVEHTEGTEVDKSVFTEEEQNLFLQQLSKVSGEALKKVTVRTGDKEVDLENTELDLEGLEHLFGPVLDEIEKSSIDDETEGTQEVQVVLGATGSKVRVTFEEKGNEDEDSDDSIDEIGEEISDDEDFKKEANDIARGISETLANQIKLNKKLKIKVAGHGSNRLKGLVRKPKKRSLTETMLVQCEECGIQVTGKSNLKSHYKRVHLRQRNFKCNICSKAFWSNNARESHVLSVHTRRCEACQEYVVESVPWAQGVDMKTQRDVICSCGAVVSIFSTFGRKRQYLRDDEPDEDGHIPETKTKPNSGTKYACGTCGKLFMKKSNCERHSRAHTDIKSCVCSVCGYSYAYESSLKKHLKNEHGIVKCVCELCGGNYSSEVALKVHMVRAHQNVALGENVAIVMQKGDGKDQGSYEGVEVEDEEEEMEEEDMIELSEVGHAGREKTTEVQVMNMGSNSGENDQSDHIIVSETGQIVEEGSEHVIHQTDGGQIIMTEQAHIVETSDGQQIVVSSTGEVIQTDGQIVQHVMQDGQVVGQGAMSIIIKQLPM